MYSNRVFVIDMYTMLYLFFSFLKPQTLNFLFCIGFYLINSVVVVSGE